MTKLLLAIVVTVGLVLFFKFLGSKRGADRADGESRARGNQVEDMVRCKVCGVNLPRSEAIMSQGRIYCCDEHRRADD